MTRSLYRRRALALLAAAVLWLTCFAAQPAIAALADPHHPTPHQTQSRDYFGQCNANSPCVADAGPHTWCYGDSLADGQHSWLNQRILDWMNKLETFSGVKAAYVGTCDTSGTAQTDVIFKAADLSTPGELADTTCMKMSDAYPTTRCDRNTIRIDQPDLLQGDNDNAEADAVVCHEVGHSLGLGHNETQSHADCMTYQVRGSYCPCYWDSGHYFTATPDGADYWHKYDDHHIAHIQSTPAYTG